MPVPELSPLPVPAYVEPRAFASDGFAFVGPSFVAAAGRTLWCWSSLDRMPRPMWTADDDIDHVSARPGCGRRMAVVAGAQVWEVAIDGEARPLVVGDMVAGTPAVWSRDGTRLAVARGEAGFGVVDVDRGSTVTIADASDADPVTWDADGLLLAEAHPLGKFKEWYYLWRGEGAEVEHVDIGSPYYTAPCGSPRVQFWGRTVAASWEGNTRRVLLPPGYGSTFSLVERECWAGERWVASDKLVALIDFGTESIAVIAEAYAAFAAATLEGDVVVLHRDSELVSARLSPSSLTWSPLPSAAAPPTTQDPLPRAVARFRSDDDEPGS